MTPFSPQGLSPEAAALLATDRLPELGPGRPNESARAILAALTPESILPQLRDRDAALACLSGLWLMHDFLAESHRISQDLHTWYGSYWHGIMHRREPDPDNAGYWFRRVPANPVFDALAPEAVELGMKGGWDPFAFVDRCERVRATASDGESLCRRVQLREMRLLFDWCHQTASGA